MARQGQGRAKKPAPARAVPSRGRSPRAGGGRGAPPERTYRRRNTDSDLGGDQVEGRRAVRELLFAGRRPVRRVLIASGQDSSEQLDEIEELAAARRVMVETVSRARLESEAKTDAHQGVIAFARELEPIDLDDLVLQERPFDPFLLVCASITDPRNLGALLRSAECAGVDGVVLPKHRTARLSPTVAKTAAGAIEYLDFATVGGIPAALERLAKLGVTTVGLAGESSRTLYDLDLSTGPVALVLGAEERGLAPLVRKRCDEVVAIPQFGSLPSLNVSVAGSISFFEVARQRSTAAHQR